MGDSNHWQRIRSPAAAGARETKTTNDATSANTDPLGEPSVSFAAAQLAVGVFGAAIVLTYPLGFITLWVQIMDTYGYSNSDALYATSMVPTSVVAGQAVFVLFGAPIAAYAMYFIAALYVWVFKWRRANKTRIRLWWLLYVGITIVVYVIPCGVIFYYTFWRNALSTVTAVVSVVAVMSLFGGSVTSASLLQRGTKAQGSGRYKRSVFIAGIPFVVGALITGVCTNILLSGIALPTIELQKKNSDERVEGTLLSHMDGSWHLINSSQPNHPLITVPNEKVFKVKIAEQ
jgi:hypothetical protein